MFGKVFKNHKLKVTDLVTNDVHAAVFENEQHQKNGWYFEAVVKLKESTNDGTQVVFEIEGVVSTDEGIRLSEINDPKFDETKLPITGQLEGKQRKAKPTAE